MKPDFAASIKDRYSATQKDALLELTQSNGWEIVSDLLNKIISKECDLESVDEKLDPVEFKLESLKRRALKKVITDLFGDVKAVNQVITTQKRKLI